MSGGTLVPAEAADLLAALQRSISQDCSDPQNGQAVRFTEVKGSVSSRVAPALELTGRLRQAEAAVEAEASAIGSLPPAPPTVRAQVGQSLVRLVNRLLWWQTAVLQRFAGALGELSRAQVDEHAMHRHSIGILEERLCVVEESLRQTGHKSSDSGVANLPDTSAESIRISEPVDSLPLGKVIAIISNAFQALKPGGTLMIDIPGTESALLAGSIQSVMQACGFDDVKRTGSGITGTRSA